jgi:dihydroxyacetone kinase DhaKLM complex PTS-EIIA-like component DhaM
MVSLIIVSHSHQLAEGVKEMAEQMAGAGVQVAAVGGLIGDSGEWLLGTDAMRIAAAIQGSLERRWRVAVDRHGQCAVQRRTSDRVLAHRSVHTLHN